MMRNSVRHRSIRALGVIGVATVCVASANRRSDAQSSTATTSAFSARTATAAVSASRTDRAIADAKALLVKNANDSSAKKALAAAYLQKVREQADPAYYTAADKVLSTMGGAKAKDPEVLLLEGALLLARHQFSAALDVGRRAAKALPLNPSAQAILVDAHNELGQFDQALAATQRMLDVRPSLASLSRASYARELRGDPNGAIEAMQQAVIAGQGGGENVAYVQTLLGDLLLKSGDISGASSVYASALRSFPDFAAARAGQAAVLFARGKSAEAARRMDEVVARQPLLQYVVATGDFYAAANMVKESVDAYALVDAIIALSRANGVDVDLEVAVFEADHKPSETLLAKTRRAAAARPGLAGHDALAWVLYRLAKHAEAKLLGPSRNAIVRAATNNALPRWEWIRSGSTG